MSKQNVEITISFVCEVDCDDIEEGLTEPVDVLEDIVAELEYTWFDQHCPLPHAYEMYTTDRTKKYGVLTIKEV